MRLSDGGQGHRRCIQRKSGGQPMLKFEKRAGRLNLGGQPDVELVAVDDAARPRGLRRSAR